MSSVQEVGNFFMSCWEKKLLLFVIPNSYQVIFIMNCK